MNSLLAMSLVGISLSMDTFSLSLCYGTLNLNTKKTILLSVIVGLFHLFMPILGLTIGNFIIEHLIIDGKYLILIILSIIGLDMIFSSSKNEGDKILTSFLSILVFAFSVSLDSFSTGIGLNLMTDNIIGGLIIFTITSSLFTFLGVRLGKKLNDKLGKISNIIGGVVLIIMGIYFFLN